MVAQGEEMVVFQGQSEASSADSWLGLGGLGVPSLTCLSLVTKYSCLFCWTPREKSSMEEEIKEKEEAIRQRSSEVEVTSYCLTVVSLSWFLSSRRRKRRSLSAVCFYFFISRASHCIGV